MSFLQEVHVRLEGPMRSMVKVEKVREIIKIMK